MVTKTRKLGKPVVFRCNRLNLRLQVSGARSESQDPTATLHPDVKMAVFRDGVFQTDDPEIMEFLDRRSEVWRMDDPAAGLKAKFGPAEYERLKAEFAQGEEPKEEEAPVPEPKSDKPSGESEE